MQNDFIKQNKKFRMVKKDNGKYDYSFSVEMTLDDLNERKKYLLLLLNKYETQLQYLQAQKKIIEDELNELNILLGN